MKKFLLHSAVTVMLLVLGVSAESYFLTIGVLFLISGAVALAGFIKNYPIITEGE